MNAVMEDTNELLAYRSWLRKNSAHIRYYTAQEIARLALACGFPIEIVCPGTCDHLVHWGKIVRFWDSPFAGKWVALSLYDRGLGE